MLIIGGGPAGISAAVPLAEEGYHVELLEKRPLLGGRASSHLDQESGLRVDECQHGTMRCCTTLSNLLSRLGVDDQIYYHNAIRFLDAQGKRSVIQGCGLPAPLHTSFSFLVFRSLGIRDKLSIARAMLAMLAANKSPDLENTDIGTWFGRMKQTDRAVSRFWAPILVSACNETIDRISCTHGFKIFRDGFLLNAKAFEFGVPSVPLATLYSDSAQGYLAERQCNVRTRATVERLLVDPEDCNRIAGVVLQGGEMLTADYYVSALQSDLLLKMLPQKVRSGADYWQKIENIELSPILGIHIWFDRTLDAPAALATLDRETEWIFNKDQNYSAHAGGGTYLSAVISASRRYADVPNATILELVLADVRACIPEAAAANVVKSKVIKWPKATFSPLPGVEAFRPDQRSPISNLYVAGEWTQTGWPSTMESAVRSGYRTAEYILAADGIKMSIVPPGLKVGLLAKALSRSWPD